MFKAFKESQKRHGPWHVAVLIMAGVALGIFGLYYMLSKRLIYCPMGDTLATFEATFNTDLISSNVSGTRFRFPANYTAFEDNQSSGTHPWLIFQGLLPGFAPNTKSLGIFEKSKLDDCDFYIQYKVVVAVVQKKPVPYWSDRGGADKLPAERMLSGAKNVAGPYGLREHRNMKLKQGYDTHPFPQVWLYSHTAGNRRTIFYCWRDKLLTHGCYTKAEPLAGVIAAQSPNLNFKYYFHRDDLKHWRKIDRESRALVRRFYEAGKK
ncbi:MAG: hypothetical protein ACKVHL_03190 [Rhodospirillales bacterium]|jgi:hypothetical protein